MDLERKVYPNWAFQSDVDEKRRINLEIYKELSSKYKIARTPVVYNKRLGCFENRNFDDYDIVLSSQSGYANVEYTILKNSTKLTNDELALICDCGNLCFGYSGGGNRIKIYID